MLPVAPPESPSLSVPCPLRTDVEVSSFSGEVLARLSFEDAAVTAGAVRAALGLSLPDDCVRAELLSQEGRRLGDDEPIAEPRVSLTAVLSHQVPDASLREFRRGRPMGEDSEMNPIYEVQLPGVRADLELAMREISVPEGAEQRLEGPIAEAQALSRSFVWHPRLARLYGAFLDAEGRMVRVFFRRLRGPSVAAVLRDGPLPIARLRRYARDVAQALQFLHGRGQPHRDVRGASIFVDAAGAVLEAPCGQLRRVAEELRAERGAGCIVGRMQKVLWMAPEVLLGDATDTLAEDVWAFACTVMEMGTGSPPWQHLMHSESVSVMQMCCVVISGSQGGARSLPLGALPEECLDFLDSMLVREVPHRPEVQEVVKHPFLVPPAG